jgi:hypothetical protein
MSKRRVLLVSLAATAHVVVEPLAVPRVGQLMTVALVAPQRATLVAAVVHKGQGRIRVVLKPKPGIAGLAKAECNRQRAMRTVIVTATE